MIRAMDYFSGPLRTMISSATAAEGKFAMLNDTMKMMGKSTAEIDAINASLNKMADQKAFGNIATDLQSIGMAKEDIAAMEGSYMQMAQYQRDMAAAQTKYAAGQEMVASGVGALTTGAIGAFGIVELVKQAADFQTKMTTIQNATGATTKQITELGYAIQNTSSQVSKFTDYDVAGFAQQLATGGFNKPGQIQSLLLPVSQFAEVQQYEGKSSDATTSVNQAIELAHTFGNYDPKSFSKFLDTFNKYSIMQPGDSSQLYNTLNYLEPIAKTMGMNSDSTMALSAIANRVGLTGTHGGTNSADFIMRLIPGLVGGTTGQAMAAMKKLGFVNASGQSTFFDKKGKIVNANQLLSTMIADSKKYNPEQLTQMYKSIFGMQGFKAAALLGNPKAYEQLIGMQKQLGKTLSMQSDVQKYLKTPEGQMSLMKSNSLIMVQRIGQQLAISLNPAIQSANKLLKSLIDFSQAHPALAKIIGDFALFAVGGKLAEGTFKILKGNFNMLSGAVDAFKIKTKAGDLTTFGKIVNKFKFKDATGELTSFGKAMTKLGDVTGLGKLGSAIKGINFSGFGNGLKSALSKLSFTGMKDSIKGIPAAFSSTKTSMLNFGTTALEFTKSLLTRFTGMGTKILSGLKSAFSWEGIVTRVRSAGVAIKAAMTLMMGPWGLVIAAGVAGVALLITHWSQITKWVKSNFGSGMPKVLTSLRNTFMQAWNGISKTVKSAWNTVSSTIVSGLGVVQKWWSSIWPELYTVLNRTWKTIAVFLAPQIALIGTIIVAGIGFIKGAWQNSWKAIQDVFKIAWDILKGVVQVAWYAISGIIQVGLDLLTGHWSAAWTHVKQMFVNIWNSIKGMFGSLIKDALDFGKNFVLMIAKGITGAVGNVVNAVKGVASKIKGFLGFHSPTKEGPASESGIWAPNFMKMFASGITTNIPLLQKASQNAANTLKNAFTGQSGSLSTNSTIQMNGAKQSGQQYTDNSQIHFQAGSIVINPQPGQDAKSLVKDFMNELGKQLKKQGYRTGNSPVNAW